MTARSIALINCFCIINLSLNLERVTAQSRRQQSNNRSRVRGSRSIAPNNYQQLATDRLKRYLVNYPGIKVYPSQLLSIDYPPTPPCYPGKQSDYIVFMVMDKISEDATVDILGDETNMIQGGISIFGNTNTLKQPELRRIMDTAIYEIMAVDRNRPALDRHSQVLYQYRLRLDPATCRK